MRARAKGVEGKVTEVIVVVVVVVWMGPAMQPAIPFGSPRPIPGNRTNAPS